MIAYAGMSRQLLAADRRPSPHAGEGRTTRRAGGGERGALRDWPVRNDLGITSHPGTARPFTGPRSCETLHVFLSLSWMLS